MAKKEDRREFRQDFREAKRNSPLRTTGLVLLIVGILLLVLLRRIVIGGVLTIVGLVLIIVARRQIKANLRSRK